MTEITRVIMLHICWFLEDVADIITHRHADKFYPSNRFEEKHDKIS